MNVRITPRGAPFRTDLYGGISHVLVEDGAVMLHRQSRHALPDVTIPLSHVAEIALDDEPGDWW